MGRPVCPELVAPEREARNYVRSQERHAKSLGFPTMASFANAIAKGTVSLAPTPEDPQLEFVGKFMWRLPRLWFLVISSHYDSSGETLPYKAVKLRIKESEFKDIKEKVLWSLRGYLMAAGE